MSREDPQMKIRLPVELRDQVAAAAEGAKRSMNAEIIARLEASFGTTPFLPGQEEAIRALIRGEWERRSEESRANVARGLEPE